MIYDMPFRGDNRMPVRGATKSEKLFPIAVLISGAGTTLKNLIEKKNEGKLPVDIKLVISSNPQAGGLQHAAAAGIPAIVVDWNKYRDPQPFSEEIFDHCRRQNVKLVVMGGFLKRLVIPPDFENRVVNIHPALIPAFCGQGFYGLRVPSSRPGLWGQNHRVYGPLCGQSL